MSILTVYSTIAASEYGLKKDDMQTQSIIHLVKSNDWLNGVVGVVVVVEVDAFVVSTFVVLSTIFIQHIYVSAVTTSHLSWIVLTNLRSWAKVWDQCSASFFENIWIKTRLV